MNRLPDEMYGKLSSMFNAIWQSQQGPKHDERNKWYVSANFYRHYFENVYRSRVLAADPDWRSNNACQCDQYFQGEQWVDLFYDLKEMDTDKLFFDRFDPFSEKFKQLLTHHMYYQDNPISFHDIQVLERDEKFKKDMQQAFSNFEKVCAKSPEYLKLLQTLQTKYLVRADEIDKLATAKVKTTVGSIKCSNCGPQTMPEFPNQPKTIDACIKAHNTSRLKERIEQRREKIDKIDIEKIVDEKTVETVCEGVVRLLLVKYKKAEKPVWESFDDVVRYFPKEISRYLEQKKKILCLYLNVILYFYLHLSVKHEIRGVYLKFPENMNNRTSSLRIFKECPNNRRKEYIPRSEDFEGDSIEIGAELRRRLRKIGDDKRKRLNRQMNTSQHSEINVKSKNLKDNSIASTAMDVDSNGSLISNIHNTAHEEMSQRNGNDDMHHAQLKIQINDMPSNSREQEWQLGTWKDITEAVNTNPNDNNKGKTLQFHINPNKAAKQHSFAQRTYGQNINFFAVENAYEKIIRNVPTISFKILPLFKVCTALLLLKK
ncbi:hypothetical protein RFI_06102 [Reticulomyxa filosa]|uniref:Uncharacterized protein n=1 Tax=Reticulomyxa filosa TaxID=46433 RepID=X6NYF7_RETFI|nr:hypothetical protein RFI_06102 [Reticulomyxa filosa]|eukprot:ETO31016.1 hypothetical protein RFI_06102 [Reticulomyxa filosa]